MPGKYRKTVQGNEERRKITVYLLEDVYQKVKEISFQNKHSLSTECENIIEKELREVSGR